MGAERRRSDRVMLTIPLRVHGVDRRGHRFVEDATTITLNRHGARIQIACPLVSGQDLRITNLLTNREAKFLVVGPLSPLAAQGGEYGVECLDTQRNIWGINFPAPQEAAESRALLECRRCHSVELRPLSFVEVEVLETAGILSRPCEKCEAATPWGYTEQRLAKGAAPEEATMFTEALGDAQGTAATVNQRRHNRVALQLPMMLRDYYGGVELTQSENISKGGLCFASEKNYLLGQGLLVVCPYSAEGQNIEVHARIVRRRDLGGTNRKIYGVRYDSDIA